MTAQALRLGVKIVPAPIQAIPRGRTGGWRMKSLLSPRSGCRPWMPSRLARRLRLKASAQRSASALYEQVTKQTSLPFDRSPLVDIRHIGDVLLVVNNGKVALNRLEVTPRQ